MDRPVYETERATVSEIVGRMATNEKIPEEDDPIYVPSLQREFCWSDKEITKLFESLLSGHPFGSILLWNVKGDIAEGEAQYFFIRYYAESSQYKNEEDDNRLKIRNKSLKSDGETSEKEYLFALDGQQRLTSLLIGLQGKYYKYRGGRGRARKNPNSYTERELFLNVLHDPENDGIDFDDSEYELKFRQYDEEMTDDGDKYWWPVGRIWDADEEEKDREIERISEKVGEDKSLIDKNITRTYEAVHEDEHLLLENVSNMGSREAVDLFVSRNDGGEPLSNSDIAFSLITVYWDKFEEDDDPKEEFESYTNELEDDFGEFNFGFGKGFVLRTLLMLNGEPPSFRRENLVQDTIEPLEKHVWTDENYKEAVYEALTIVTEEIGLGSKCITSLNSILPIIDYCYVRLDNGEEIDNPPLDAMEYWLSVTVLNNLLTIGSERLLKTAHEKIVANGGFPVEDILSEFEGRAVKLDIDEDRLKEVIEETDYSSRAAKNLLLTKIYSDGRISGVRPEDSMDAPDEVVGDAESSMEVDHIYPQDKLDADDEEKMTKRGLSGDENENRMGNLQLLVDNQSKGKKDPETWLKKSDKSREELVETHMLRLPDELEEYSYENFKEFCDGREREMVKILKEKLSVEKFNVSSS